MKILFITATNLGDGILSTGALDHLIRQHPGAEITVACGPVLAGIFAAAPGVRNVIPMKKEPYAGHWRKLAKATFRQRWDIVVDLRNSLVSRLLLSKKTYVWEKHDQNKHKVEQIADILGVAPAPSPCIWFTPDILAEAERTIPEGEPVVAIAPAARWRGKTWPTENFVGLIGHLTASYGLIPKARVAVFAAPGEENIAYTVLNQIPQERQINMIAKLSPLQAAAAISRCSLYIGNDSGLTHLAAAVGAPTLALFGPTPAALYRPWGRNADYVSTPETPEQLTGYPGYRSKSAPCLMTTLTVTAAQAAAVKLWKRTYS